MADILLISEESEVVYTNVINCVSIFYEKGASGSSFLRKEKFRAEIKSDVSTVKALKQIVSQFGGIYQVAKSIGLGNNIDIKLARLDKSDTQKGTQCYAINTDNQVRLELPTIRTGSDSLQVTVYPVNISFAKSCPRIVVCIDDQEIKKHKAKETERELKSEQQQLLSEELKKLANSELVKEDVASASVKKRKVNWPWKIKCGICHCIVQLRIDSSIAGRISYFKSHHFDACKEKRKQINKQSTISEMFGKKRKKDDQDVGTRTVTGQVELIEVDSDLDFSDVEDDGGERK